MIVIFSKMNNSDWFVNYNLPRNFHLLEFAQDGNTYLFFEREPLTLNNGYQSAVLVGRIIYKDESENIHRSPSIVVKIFPGSFQRNTFTEITFANEIFAYNKLIPFFASLEISARELFPKFYFGNLIIGRDNEDGCVILENLQSKGYHSSESKVFLDIQHLRLMMKKLGEFHAYSYLAKDTHPVEFFSLVNNLVETNFATVNMLPNFQQSLLEFYLDLLSQDERYKEKADSVRRIITNADEFVADVFSARNEPTSALCHGDFLRNNVLFKYDSNDNPVDMKFIDVANMKYCTPVVDLALVLYMNTDQFIRDEYWDELIDVYYESLKNTFPRCSVPTKDQIISEFKRNSLQAFLFVMYFVPASLASECSVDGDWASSLYSPEYEEYKNKPLVSIPNDVLVFVVKKIHVGKNRELVLDALKDMINKGFI